MSGPEQPTPARADRRAEIDFVPILGFQAIDFVEQGLGEKLSLWQKRVVIDAYGAGPIEEDDHG